MSDLPSNLHAFTQERWNYMANTWVETAGQDGNEFHVQFVSPTAEKLLEIRRGEDEVLEITCGAGVFAKKLHDLGAKYIVASDFSSELLKATMKRCEGLNNMEFMELDATDEQGFVDTFGLNRFHKAVCNMGLMDMSEIDPLFSAMFKVLKPGGIFVFTILHPCFKGNGATKGIEEVVDPHTGEKREVFYIKMTAYLDWKPSWGRGLRTQPIKHLSFHRPLHEIFSVICNNGFVVDGLEEPGYTGGQIRRTRECCRWDNFTQFPPIIGIRCKKPL